MLRYLCRNALEGLPALRTTMFRDRARQFSDRLGWDVEVDGSGAERDEYDELDPVYVIWQRPDGRHGGSMRFLPTTGRNMLNEHFSHLLSAPVSDGLIWESTRFCLAPGSGPKTSAALMLGGLELGLALGLSASVGVFDARMFRIYARLGWPPEILGGAGEGRDRISAGLWRFDAELRGSLLEAACIGSEASSAWIRNALGGSTPDAGRRAA